MWPVLKCVHVTNTHCYKLSTYTSILMSYTLTRLGLVYLLLNAQYALLPLFIKPTVNALLLNHIGVFTFNSISLMFL